MEKIREGISALSELIHDLVSGRTEHLDENDPNWLKGDALCDAVSDTRLIYQTVYGQPLSVTIHADGRLTGVAGYANEESDTGKWWVEGDMWVRQWEQWAYAEAVKLYTVIEKNRIKWFGESKILFNRAIIHKLD